MIHSDAGNALGRQQWSRDLGLGLSDCRALRDFTPCRLQLPHCCAVSFLALQPKAGHRRALLLCIHGTLIFTQSKNEEAELVPSLDGACSIFYLSGFS